MKPVRDRVFRVSIGSAAWLIGLGSALGCALATLSAEAVRPGLPWPTILVTLAGVLALTSIPLLVWVRYATRVVIDRDGIVAPNHWSRRTVIPWEAIRSVSRQEMLGIPMLKLIVPGARWAPWIPARYQGQRRFVEALAELAPDNHPLWLAVETERQGSIPTARPATGDRPRRNPFSRRILTLLALLVVGSGPIWLWPGYLSAGWWHLNHRPDVNWQGVELQLPFPWFVFDQSADAPGTLTLIRGPRYRHNVVMGRFEHSHRTTDQLIWDLEQRLGGKLTRHQINGELALRRPVADPESRRLIEHWILPGAGYDFVYTRAEQAESVLEELTSGMIFPEVEQLQDASRMARRRGVKSRFSSQL